MDVSLSPLSHELDALRKRVAELEATLQDQQNVIDNLRSQKIPQAHVEAPLDQWLEFAPDGVIVVDEKATIVRVNQQIGRLFGYAPEDLEGKPIEMIIPERFRSGHIHMRNGYIDTPHVRPMGVGLDLVALHKNGEEIPVEVSLSPMKSAEGRFVISTLRDVRQRKQAEIERSQMQEEIIRMQSLLLDVLSTPLLTVGEGILVMPLIGAMDTRRADHMVETLLQGVSERGADFALIDITGVPVVDTQVAAIFLRCVQAVRLLGAQVVITGIRPEIAQTLVGLDVDMSQIVTLASLQDGIAYASQQQDLS